MMLSVAGKRKVPSSDSSSDSDEDCMPPAIRDITANVSAYKANDSNFRVMYIVTFTKPCCDNHKQYNRMRIQVASELSFFDEVADTCELMMAKTIKAIRSHRISKKFDGLVLCHLDYRIGIGAVYMSSSDSSRSLWRLVYSSAEKDMNKILLKRSENWLVQLTQHDAKSDAAINAGWEKGCDFKTRQLRWKACRKVEQALCVASKKSTVKATLLYYQISYQTWQSQNILMKMKF